MASTVSGGVEFANVVNLDHTPTAAWQNPGNVETDDANYSSASLTDTTLYSDYLRVLCFPHFQLPYNAVIKGIEVSVKAYASPDLSVATYKAMLTKDGGASYTSPNATAEPETDWVDEEVVHKFGGLTELWGTVWSPADFVSDQFGFAFSIENPTPLSSAILYVNYVSVTIYYELARFQLIDDYLPLSEWREILNESLSWLYDQALSLMTEGMGPQGPQGVQGAQGVGGGPAGPQGTTGAQGVQGSQGIQGTQGSLGAQGTQGVGGPQGVQGPQGPSGGATGPQGTQGPQGVQGSQGHYGAQGVPGVQGTGGAQGVQGPQGTPGGVGQTYKGTTTTAGLTIGLGSKSFTTNQGLAYLPGARARVTMAVEGYWMEGIVTAYSISTGAMTLYVDKTNGSGGTQGGWNLNVAGEPGAQGTQGAQGWQGTAGPQGVQGPFGNQGMQGQTGPQGAQGPQGSQGIRGPQGITGPQGPQGVQGPPGQGA